MKGFWRHWVVSALALALTAWALPGVRVSGLVPLLWAAIILGFLNAVVKPIFVILTLPATILTLGLFYFVLNGLFFGFAAGLVPGFSVDNFGWAMFGALAMGLVSNLLNSLWPDERERR
jgi:putative membrane protein